MQQVEAVEEVQNVAGKLQKVINLKSAQTYNIRTFDFSLLKILQWIQVFGAVIFGGFLILISGVAILVLTITAMFGTPEPNPDFVTTYKKVPVKISALLNDKDPKGDKIWISAVQTPLHGNATISEDGTYITYTSNPYWSGIETFYYTCSNKKLSAQALITVHVFNHPPTVIPLTYTIPKNSKDYYFEIFKFVDSITSEKITDLDDDILTVLNVTKPSHGNVSFDSNGIYYTPDHDFNSVDSLNYTITDFNSTSSSILNIIVNNDAPVAVRDLFSIPKYKVAVLNVLANDYDINGDNITITSATSAQYGAISPQNSAKFINYYPALMVNPYVDSFEYYITDGSLTASTFGIIRVVNFAPDHYNNSVNIPKNSQNQQINILYSDTDSLDTLFVSLQPNQNLLGIATINLTSVDTKTGQYLTILADFTWNNYSLFYLPKRGLIYSEKIYYLVTDTIDTTLNYIEINVVNSPPIAKGTTVNCGRNYFVNIDAMINDYDPNGDEILLYSVQSPSNSGAIITISSDKKYLIYTPPVGFNSTDSFQYTITDIYPSNTSLQLTATATIYVNIINFAPISNNDYFFCSRGNYTYLDILANDTDPNRDSISINYLDSKTVGGIPLSIVNNKVFLQCSNFSVVDSFQYNCMDIYGAVSNMATSYVSTFNVAPIAYNVVGNSVHWNNSITITTNCYDPNPNDDPNLLINSVSCDYASSTSTIVGGRPAVLISSNLGYVGTVICNYNVIDPYGAISNTAIINLSVTNNPLIISSSKPIFWMHQGTSKTFDIIIGDYDTDSDPIYLIYCSKGIYGGTCSINSNQIIFTPVSGFIGIEQITYTITDYNLNAQGTVNIIVNDTAPIAGSQLAFCHWNSIGTSINTILGSSDVDGDILSLISFSIFNGFLGSLSQIGNLLNYAPNHHNRGVFYSNFTLSDGALTSTNLITITVTNNIKPNAQYFQRDVHWRNALTGITFNILSSIIDGDGDSNVISFSYSGSSSVSIGNGGLNINYQTSNFLGNEIINYNISDGCIEDISSNKINITVYDNPPVVKNYQYNMQYYELTTGVLFSVISDTTDPDIQDTTFTVVSIIKNNDSSEAYMVGNQLKYIPPPNYSGYDWFFYQVSDGKLNSSFGIINVTVPFLPTGLIFQSYNYQWSLKIAIIDIISQIQVQPDEILNITSINYEGQGSAIKINNGTIDLVFYTFPNGFLGTEPFSVYYSGDKGTNGFINITVTIYDEIPTLLQPTFYYNWTSLKPTGVLLNFSNYVSINGSDILTIVNCNSPKIGIFYLEDGKCRYYTNSPFFGTDSFYYIINTGIANYTQSAIINSNDISPLIYTKNYNYHFREYLNGINITLIDNNDILFISGEQWTNTQITGVIYSPSDVGATYSLLSTKIATIKTTNLYTGTIQITFSSSNGLLSTTGTININIYDNSPSSSSFVISKHWSTFAAGNYAINVSNYIDDVDSLDIPYLSIYVTVPPSSGSSISIVGNIIQYSGPTNPISISNLIQNNDTISFYDFDGILNSQISTIKVIYTNKNPNAYPYTNQTLWRNSLIFSLNCSDFDGDAVSFSFTSSTSNSYGSISWISQAKGIALFTPNVVSWPIYPDVDGKYRVTSSFTYQCVDGANGIGSSTIAIKVYDSKPIPIADTYYIYKNKTDNKIYNFYVMLNDSDVDGDSIVINNVQPITSNFLTLSFTSNYVIYQPISTFSGVETLQYSITDGKISSNLQIITINVLNTPIICSSLITKNVSKNYQYSFPNLTTEFSCYNSNGDSISIWAVYYSGTLGTTSLSNEIVYYHSGFISGTDSIIISFTDGAQFLNSTLKLNIMNLYGVSCATVNHIHRRPKPKDVTVDIFKNCSDPDGSTNFQILQIGTDYSGCFITSNAGTLNINNNNLILRTGANYYENTCIYSLLISDGDTFPIINWINFTLVYVDDPPFTVPDWYCIHDDWLNRVYSWTMNEVGDINGDIPIFGYYFFPNDPLKTTVGYGYTTISTSNTVPDPPQLTFYLDENSCDSTGFMYNCSTYGKYANGTVHFKKKICNCRYPLDLVFVIDSSYLVTNYKYNRMKLFAQTMVSDMDQRTVYRDYYVNFGVVQYGNDAVVVSPLTSNHVTTANALKWMRQLNGNSATTQGLMAAFQMLKNGRSNAKKTIILFSDGVADTIGTLYPTCSSLYSHYNVTPLNPPELCQDPTVFGAFLNKFRPDSNGNLWKVISINIGATSTIYENVLKNIQYTQNYLFQNDPNKSQFVERDSCDRAYFDDNICTNNDRSPNPPGPLPNNQFPDD